MTTATVLLLTGGIGLACWWVHQLPPLAKAGLALVILALGVRWALGAIPQVGAVTAVLLLFGAAVMWAANSGPGRVRTVHISSGHGPRVAAIHEGGHAAVAKAVGGRVEHAWIRPDGSGMCRVRLPETATAADWIAVNVAGEVASGTRAGCHGDQAAMREELAALPPGERAAAKAAGYATARRVLRGWGDGGAAKVADALMRDGVYRGGR